MRRLSFALISLLFLGLHLALTGTLFVILLTESSNYSPLAIIYTIIHLSIIIMLSYFVGKGLTVQPIFTLGIGVAAIITALVFGSVILNDYVFIGESILKL